MIEKEIVLNKYMDEKKKSQTQKNPKHKKSQTQTLTDETLTLSS